MCVATAAQAALSVELDQSQRAEQEAQGVRPAQQGRGVAAQVALARRESHHRGQRHLGLAKIVAAELPHTWAAWRAGRITEWKATLVARETACLTRDDRLAVDAAVCGDATRLERMGDRELATACQKEAYRLDPESYVARRRKAEADRNVTLRPAPDAMTWMTALLPVKEGVAAYAALTRTADSARAAGDPRTKGQVMADTWSTPCSATASARDEAATRWDPAPTAEAAGGPRTHARECGHRARPGDDRRSPVRHERRARPRRRLRPDPRRAGPRDRRRGVRRGREDLAPAALHQPRHRRAASRWTRALGCSATRSPGSSGCATRSAALPGATPRSDIPTMPTGVAEGGPTECGQRTGTVRGLQPRQAGARVAGQTLTRRGWPPDRDHDSHRSHLRLEPTGARDDPGDTDPARPRAGELGASRATSGARPPRRRATPRCR